MQFMWKHRRAVTERGASGRFGRRCLPYLAVFHVLLPLIAPVVDVAMIYGFIFLSPLKVAAFCWRCPCSRFWSAGMRCSWTASGCGQCGSCPLQQVVYRQLLYLVTVQSVITALLGTRQRWQPIRRAGIFSAPPPAPASPGTPTPGRCNAMTAPGVSHVRCQVPIPQPTEAALAAAAARNGVNGQPPLDCPDPLPAGAEGAGPPGRSAR
jgi:hypothetical protein